MPLMRQPLFIRGIMPRSGTNFLQDAVCLHQDTAQNPNNIWEFPHFQLSELLVGYTEQILKSPHAREFQPEKLIRYFGDAWLNYLSEFVESDKMIVMKYPSVDYLDDVFRFFPEARLVIIVRDGRDVVASALKSGFVAPPPFSIMKKTSWRRLLGPSDFALLCNRYASAVDNIINFEHSDILERKRNHYLRINYEDLNRSTSGEIRKVLEWAGLSAERYDFDRLNNLPVRGSSYNKQEKLFQKTQDFKPHGRWKSWTQRERRIFEKIAGRAMRVIGYNIDWN